MTDWQQWHRDYADPDSVLSRRLAAVQLRIRSWIEAAPPGPLQVVSVCGGQGHDLIGGLTDSPRAGNVEGLLVEADPVNAAAASRALAEAGLGRVQVLCADAGSTSVYADAVPADLLLLCGIFGNVPDDDVRRTVAASASLCAPGATVIWTRHRREPDLTPAIRSWFRDAGFIDVAFDSPGAGAWAVGTQRLTGPPPAYEKDVRLFRFDR